jgi:hypothetical protein
MAAGRASPTQNTNSCRSDVVIAVMGVTGSGKSSFISHLPVQSVSAGHGLESCTPVEKPRQISGGLTWYTDDIALRRESKDCGVLDELPQTVISNDQTSHQNLEKNQFVLCDAGGGAVVSIIEIPLVSPS